MADRLYPHVDHIALGQHYINHVQAMTAEGLHEKSAIAAQLAWRDDQIAQRDAELARLAAERDDARAELSRLRGEVAAEREARNTIARENAERIGREVDAAKEALASFARAILDDRDWYCHDHDIEDVPLMREMAAHIEAGESRGLIEVVMGAVVAAQPDRQVEAAEQREREAYRWAAEQFAAFARKIGMYGRSAQDVEQAIAAGPAQPVEGERG